MTTGRSQQGLRVLDEALKLIDAFQQSRPEPSPDHAQTHDRPEGTGECRVCPICRGLALLREANPEAATRMGRAVEDLVAAFGDLLAGPAPDSEDSPAAPPGPAEPRPVRLQHIDVTD